MKTFLSFLVIAVAMLADLDTVHAQSTGSIQATLRNWNNANATASLTRFVRWPSGQQITGSNPGTFTGVPPGGYWVEGYQRGPFSDYEYWGSVYANVSAARRRR